MSSPKSTRSYADAARSASRRTAQTDASRAPARSTTPRREATPQRAATPSPPRQDDKAVGDREPTPPRQDAGEKDTARRQDAQAEQRADNDEADGHKPAPDGAGNGKKPAKGDAKKMDAEPDLTGVAVEEWPVLGTKKPRAMKKMPVARAPPMKKKTAAAKAAAQRAPSPVTAPRAASVHTVSSDSSDSGSSDSDSSTEEAPRKGDGRKTDDRRVDTPPTTARLRAAMKTAGVTQDALVRTIGECADTPDVAYVPEAMLMEAVKDMRPLDASRMFRLRELCREQGPAKDKVRLTPRHEAEEAQEEMDGECVRNLIARYERRYGGPPSFEEEPTAKQLREVQKKLEADQSPWVDFSGFGPASRELGKPEKSEYLHLTTDGRLRRDRAAGPSSFSEWWKAWRTYRCALLLLGAARPASLDSYAETVRTLAGRYGWDAVYPAENKMRKYEFERIRRHCERQGADRRMRDTPWDVVLAAAATATNYWNEEVKEKFFLRQRRGSSRRRSRSSRSKSSGRQRRDRRGRGDGRRRSRRRSPPRKAKKRARVDGTERSGRLADGRQVCFAYNRKGCTEPCPNGREHVCEKCHGPHKKTACDGKRR